MALSLLYLAFVRLLQLPRFHLTDRDDLAIEVVMLNPWVMVLGRQVGCPALRPADRAVLAGLIRLVSKVRRGRFLVQPEAMLGWRRDLVCRRWTFRQKALPGWLVLPTGPVQLVVRSARENPTWATEESTVSWPR